MSMAQVRASGPLIMAVRIVVAVARLSMVSLNQPQEVKIH